MKRITWSALVPGVLFIPGLVMTMSIPGGGDAVEKDFTDYYGSGGRRAVGTIGVALLSLAAVALVWFAADVRRVLAARRVESTGAYLIPTFLTMGATLFAAGAAIMVGPTFVQSMSNREFVGVPVAHTFVQAGLGLTILGGGVPLVLGVFLAALLLRRSGAIAGWVGIAGLVAAGLMLLLGFMVVGFLAMAIWLLIVAFTGMRAGAETAMA